MDPLLRYLLDDSIPNIFVVPGRFRTRSIRDQMVRGALIGDYLADWPRRLQQWPVLVVGAGAAGANVSARLLDRGVEVHVAEPNGGPFQLQRGCHQRFIDPTEYDWPLPHWTQGQFFPDPLAVATPSPMPPFPWAGNAAAVLVAMWDSVWAGYSQRYEGPTAAVADRLRLFWGYRANGRRIYGNVDGSLDAYLESPNRPTYRQTYAAIVWTTGSAPESCTLPSSPQFRGVEFWEGDDLHRVDSGLPPGSSPDDVVIAGSGDGAIQDLLRAATRYNSAREIWDALLLGQVGVDLAAIASAERLAEHTRPWVDDAASRAARQALHQTYQAVADDALIRDPNLGPRIDNLLRLAPRSTVLLTRKDSFSCIYPLNRFLGMLILTRVESLPAGAGPAIIWHRGSELLRVTNAAPTGGPPPATSRDCYGHPWEVRLRLADGTTPTVDANIVVLRQGSGGGDREDPPNLALPFQLA